MTVLHADSSPEARRVVTAWICVLWLVRLIADPITELSALPLVAFAPVAPAAWLPRALEAYLLEPLVLQCLRLASILALAFVCLGRHVDVSLLVAGITLTTIQAVLRGFGHVNHAELCLLYALYAIAFVSVIERVRGPRMAAPALTALPLVLIAAVVCLTYALTGIYRLAHGGATVFTSGSMTSWVIEASYMPANPQFRLGRLVASPIASRLLEVSLVVITLMEVTALCALTSKRYRAVFVPTMAIFHGAVFLSMNIVFWENLALLPLLTTWPKRFDPQPVTASPPIIFFDGVCGLCNWFVDYVIARDRTSIFRFAPLQSSAAALHLSESARSEDAIALMDNAGITYRRSEAVLRAIAKLGGVNAAARMLLIVPAPVRDWVYDLVAQRRYQLGGKRDVCRLPSPAERVRFLA